jgi:hypothetical protein
MPFGEGRALATQGCFDRIERIVEKPDFGRFGGRLRGIFSWRNLHRRWRADSACLDHPEITPPSSSYRLRDGTKR